MPHPDIISESGRAVVAYYSVLVFNILDVNRFEAKTASPIAEDAPPMLQYLHELRKEMVDSKKITPERLQEIYNDAVYYRDKIRSTFNYGKVSLRERAAGEEIYWEVLNWIAMRLNNLGQSAEQMDRLGSVMTDFYYGNFSVFQSMPDFWAIDQLFPVMPIHRLQERPNRLAVLSDITCDCDGKVDKFIHSRELHGSIPVHELKDDEDYMMAVFLVGAYQETLGDLHNLLGDTNVISVKIEDGQLAYTRELEGDSVAEVLSYVEYEPKDLIRRLRSLAEGAVTSSKISAVERRVIVDAYEEGMRGYTYFAN